ncbi:MAG: outer membrane beta-barrel protein [Polyangiales bacterium]
MRCVSLALGMVLFAASASASSPSPRHPGELTLGLGVGNAVCDDKKPDSQCPVGKAGGALSLSGGWRFHPHWFVGLEIAAFQFNPRDEWRGQLQDPATEIKFNASYIAPHARWYWFGKGTADAYLQAGLGVGSVTGSAKNAGGSFEVKNTGLVVPVAIGVEWYLFDHFRLGPQLSAHLQKSGKHCETTNGGSEACRDATNDDNALVWRLLVVSGSFVFG